MPEQSIKYGLVKILFELLSILNPQELYEQHHLKEELTMTIVALAYI